MAENGMDVASSRLSVSIPEGNFLQLWTEMPERMKESLLANPTAVVTYKDGTTIPVRDFIAMKKAENKRNSLSQIKK